MDRSGRRSAVAAFALTAGVLIGAAAPALADDRGSGSPDGSSSSAGAAAPHRTRTPGATEAPTASRSPGIRGPGTGGAPPSPDDPCPWLRPPAPAPVRVSDGGLVIGAPEAVGAPVVATFGDSRTVGGALGGDVDVDPPLGQPGPTPVSGPGIAPPQGAPGPPAPPAAPAPPLPAPSGPVAPPAASPSAVVAAVPAAPAPAAPRLPAQLGTVDDLGRIVATALPGLAALVGMTLFGGVIGYRQARAGYLVRAAGAGRFLQ